LVYIVWICSYMWWRYGWTKCCHLIWEMKLWQNIWFGFMCVWRIIDVLFHSWLRRKIVKLIILDDSNLTEFWIWTRQSEVRKRSDFVSRTSNKFVVQETWFEETFINLVAIYESTDPSNSFENTFNRTPMKIDSAQADIKSSIVPMQNFRSIGGHLHSAGDLQNHW
jgi:hypothetical protein